ncbi:MAG TPA: hypothetical protein PK668_05045 [Myxococcota bacterium]|nr:hypothetical protein [Myxococcota bacterium]HRY92224.1 hypothetical protein [Myxococcota bacterium]
MADSYTQFSEAIRDLTSEEVDWLKAELHGPPFPNHMTDRNQQEALAKRWFNDRGITDLDGSARFVDLFDCWPGFEFAFQKTVNGGTEVWLYADESANLDYLANVAQRFLARFRPNACFGLSWAGTCSRMRVGEFGGGAMFVTAKGIEWKTTWDFIDEQRQKFEAAKQRVRPKKNTNKPAKAPKAAA